MTRLTSISLAGTIGRNYYGGSRDPGIVTKSIGTNSRDYSTISLWEADLDNASVYMADDEAVGECYNDSTFAPFTINGGATIGLKSITLKAAAGEAHDGTVNTGVKVQSTANWQPIVTLGLSGVSKPIKIEGLEIVSAHKTAHPLLSVSDNSHNKAIVRCIFRDAQSSTNNIKLGVRTAFWRSIVANCVIYDLKYGISGNNYYTGSNYVNNTIHTNDGYALSTRESNISKNVMKNNLLFSRNQGSTYAISGSNPTSTPNWDSNMVGSGPMLGENAYTDVSIDNMFISTVRGSQDYHLRSQFDYENYAPAVGLGVNVSSLVFINSDATGFGAGIATKDIDFLSRAENWDIGADQTPTTVTKTIGTNSRDYATISLWEADLDNSECYFYEDRAVGECYNDSVFYESFSLNGGGTLGLYSVKLVAPQSERHDGTAGSGVTIRNPSNYQGTSVTANVPVSFEYLIFDQASMYGVQMDISSSSYLFHMSRCIIHSGLNWMVRNYSTSIIDNCILYDSSNSGGQGASIYSGAGTLDCINNTLADHVYGIRRDSGTVAAVNCIAVSDPSSGNIRISDFSGTMTQKHNLSSDTSATGVGFLASQAYDASMFRSILAGSEDYHLNSESSAVRAGYNALSDYSSYSTIAFDIDGIARSPMQEWDIGADQTSAGGGMLLLGIG